MCPDGSSRSVSSVFVVAFLVFGVLSAILPLGMAPTTRALSADDLRAWTGYPATATPRGALSDSPADFSSAIERVSQTASSAQIVQVNSNSGNSKDDNGNGDNESNGSSNILGDLLTPQVLEVIIIGAALFLTMIVCVILTTVFAALTARRTRQILNQLKASSPASVPPAAAAPVVAAAAVAPVAAAPLTPAPLSQGPSCASCGEANLKGAKFCSGCGKPLAPP